MIVSHKQGNFNEPGEPLPLVTFAVICYEHERYITEALESALAQAYSPLEIVISDDCSADSTYEKVKRIVAEYVGPHKVIINRNETNLGISGNVNKIWELASGELVIFQGGDDASFPHRTSTLVKAWLSREPRPDLVYSGAIHVDETGNKLFTSVNVVSVTPSIGDTITGKNIFIAGGCASAYARQIHFVVGPLNNEGIAEDFVYSFRALLGNGVLGVAEPLVRYRQHSESILGNIFGDKKQSNSARQEILLNARLAILKEYRRAMNVYGNTNPYLRWRLARNIKTTEMLLDLNKKGFAGKILLMTWALFSIRPRTLISMAIDSADIGHKG